MTDFTQPINYGWSGPWLAAITQILNSIGALTLVFAFRYGKAIVVAPLDQRRRAAHHGGHLAAAAGHGAPAAQARRHRCWPASPRCCWRSSLKNPPDAVPYPGLSEQYLIAHGAESDRARDRAAAAGLAANPGAAERAARERSRRFLAPLLALDDLRIILTGAGSSAYIGQCLAPELLRALAHAGRGHRDHGSGQRSARLPATRGADAAGVLCALRARAPRAWPPSNWPISALSSCHHLIITCNAGGGAVPPLAGEARATGGAAAGDHP